MLIASSPLLAVSDWIPYRLYRIPLKVNVLKSLSSTMRILGYQLEEYNEDSFSYNIISLLSWIWEIVFSAMKDETLISYHSLKISGGISGKLALAILSFV